MSQSKNNNPALGADYSEKMKNRYAEKVKPSGKVYSKSDRRQNQVVSNVENVEAQESENETQEEHQGSCLCGAVQFKVKGEMRPVIVCHCGQCCHTHGHYGAYSSANKSNVEFVNKSGLKWFHSSDFARRGFCQECGASIFYERIESAYISFAAGMLENPTGIKTIGHIYVDDKPDYYEITDDFSQFSQASNGGLHGDSSE